MTRFPFVAWCLGLAFFLAPVAQAAASTWSNSTVAYISCVAGQNYCSVTLAASAPVSPACATNGPSMTIPLANNENSDAMLKLIMAAKAANWQISLIGTGACATMGTQEDISMVQVH